MMKTNKSLLSIVLVLCLAFGLMTGCGKDAKQTEDNQSGLQQDVVPPTEAPTATSAPKEVVDYASKVELNMSSNSAKVEATVKTYVDGDTTHFYVSSDLVEGGILKARYLAINTPESTGKIEEYGKKASNFTKEKLSQATSIIIESDTDHWDIDSTGSRNLVWVWYKTADSDQYRNLNIEILQNGLALANSAANNRYGSYCTAAIAQAKEQKLNIYSGQKDPDFYYGEAVELTLKELRTNIDQYNGIKVAFNAIVTKDHSNSVYVEAYDEETGVYYGISIYYGFNLSGPGLSAISVGNEARIVGTVQYYEAGGTYQVAGLSYRQMKPNDPNNVQKLSEGHEPAFVPTTADTFVNGTVEVETEEGMISVPYAKATMNTSLSMENLKVLSVHTTTNEDSSSYGAMTLECEADGIPVTVRTVVLTDANGKLVTADAFEGKTIDVKGIVDFFDGQYQIKVFSVKDITIK